MLISIKRRLREERGDTLTFALVAMALCAVLVTPLLTKVRSGFEITEHVQEQTQRQLSADAGIEMALWRLTNDSAFQQSLIAAHEDEDADNDVFSVPMPPVNGVTSALDMVCVSTEYTLTNQIGDTDQYLRWVLWGNNLSTKDTINVIGSNNRVYGDVRANYQFKVAGQDHLFYGDVEWVTLKTAGNGHTFVPALSDAPTPPRDFPMVWEADDFRPGGKYAIAAAAEGKYFEHWEAWSWADAGEKVPEGLHYCHDDVSISGAGTVGTNVTIVSEANIHISGAGVNFTPYIAGLSLFSTKESQQWVVKISGSGNTGGASFAPWGTLELAGSGGTIIGAFLGDKVHITGSGYTIGLAAVPIGSYEQRLVAASYDVRSTVGETTITARVEQDFGSRSTWRVYNLNSFPVDFTWDIPGTDASGAGKAYAGQVQFTTPQLQAGQQIRLHWVDADGAQQMAIADLSTHDTSPPGPVTAPVVTSVCSDDPSAARLWKVHNVNSYPVAVHWELLGSLQTGTVVAPPGDSYFASIPIGGANVVRAYWYDYDETIVETTVTSTGASCGSTQVVPLGLLSLGESAGFTPSYHVMSWHVD